MEYLGRFEIDARKIEPTPAFRDRLGKKSTRTAYRHYTYGDPQRGRQRKVQKGGRKNNSGKKRKPRKDIHQRIQEGRKSGIRGDHTEPYLQKKSTSKNTVFSIEQEAIIKAI
jgi:hypothetical protein